MKPFTFDGRNFKKRHNQMRFWLTIFGLVTAISDLAKKNNGSAPEGAIHTAVNRPVT